MNVAALPQALPGVRPAPVKATVEADATTSTDRVDLVSGWRKPAAVFCGIMALSGAAHAADMDLAATPPPTTHEFVLDSKPVAQQYFFIGQQNDSMPSWLNWVPTSASNRNPFTHQADDNGWTAEVRADYAKTEGNTQWVGEGRWSMVTQRGSWIPGPDYHGYRTDFAELAGQKNTEYQISDNTTLYTGIGGGAQVFGPMGGHTVQLWVHTHMPFGGRTDAQGLQTNYTTHSLSLTPEVTGGIGLDHALNSSQSLKWSSSLQGNATVEGYSTARAQTGLKFQGSRLDLEAGVSVEAVYDNQPATAFMHDSGVRPGEYVEADYNVFKNFRLYGRVQDDGVRGEPQYLAGFSFGGGAKPWLDPLFH
jgi:hypothetical protein